MSPFVLVAASSGCWDLSLLPTLYNWGISYISMTTWNEFQYHLTGYLFFQLFAIDPRTS
jgi:hypothetical protein